MKKFKAGDLIVFRGKTVDDLFELITPEDVRGWNAKQSQDWVKFLLFGDNKYYRHATDKDICKVLSKKLKEELLKNYEENL